MKLRWCKRTRSKSPNGEIQAYPCRWRPSSDGAVGEGPSGCRVCSVSTRLGRTVRCGGLHFSPSRTSRPVGRSDLWPAVEPVPGRLGSPCRCRARTRGDLIGARRYRSLGRDRTEVASDACLTGCTRTGPYPVCGATAFDTRPTRLETRTKECNMYASHWALRNLKAK